MNVSEHGKAVEALRLAAKGEPHSGADLALALALFRESAPTLAPADLGALTPAEKEVVRMVAKEGLKTKAIAKRMRLAEKTVKNHLYKSMKTLGVHSRSGLVAAFWGTR